MIPTDDMTGEHARSMNRHLLYPDALFSLSTQLPQSPTLAFPFTVSDLKTVPNLVPTKEYPSSPNCTGNACFVCESDQDLGDIGSMTSSDCPRCSPTVTLDLAQGQRVLEHIGSHILYDPTVIQSIEPLCGLCLRPAQLCQFYLEKGKGAKGNGIAAESTASSPCSNVPIHCPICPQTDPAIKYERLWKLSNFERSKSRKFRHWSFQRTIARGFRVN